MDCKSLRSLIVNSRFCRSGYSTEEARLIFCDLRRMQLWLYVEAALATSQASLGITPLSAADELIRTADLHQLDLKEVSRSIQSTAIL